MTSATTTPRVAPTLEMVAAEAGVSRATVSRVVNGSPKVSPEVMENVQAAIARLGYTPNRAARSLANRRSMVIALVVPEDTSRLFGDPYFIKYVTGMAMMDYATHLSFTDMQLAGNSKINTDRIYDRGDKLVIEVKEYIKGITKGGFFFNRTR